MTPRSLLEEKILQAEPRITPLRFDDYTLFRQFGSGYKNTLTYNAQAVNGWNPKGISHHRLGLKYYDRRNLASIGYFQRYTGSSHFHLIPCEAKTEKVRELAELLFELSQSPVYVKKISAAQRDELLARPGFKDVTAEKGWYAEAPLEDDTYPEQILDIEITLAELGKSRKNSQLKDKYVRASKRYGEKIKFEQYKADDPEQRRIAMGVVKNFFQIQREKQNHLSQPEDYYNLINIKPQHTTSWSSLLYVESTPAGFYLAEKKGKTAHLKKEPPTAGHRPAGCSLRSGRFLWSASAFPRTGWRAVLYATGQMHRSEASGTPETSGFLSGPGGKHCALYANIALHDKFPYLSEFLMVHLLQELQQSGITFLNLGGSETSGLHHFKQKFRPMREEQMLWAAYER